MLYHPSSDTCTESEPEPLSPLLAPLKPSLPPPKRKRHISLPSTFHKTISKPPLHKPAGTRTLSYTKEDVRAAQLLINLQPATPKPANPTRTSDCPFPPSLLSAYSSRSSTTACLGMQRVLNTYPPFVPSAHQLQQQLTDVSTMLDEILALAKTVACDHASDQFVSSTIDRMRSTCLVDNNVASHSFLADYYWLKKYFAIRLFTTSSPSPTSVQN